MRILQNCDRCSGSHSVEGCPQPRLEMSEIFELYWPPNPNPDSWVLDTPNEGISIEQIQGQTTICSYGADYHGYDLLEPGHTRDTFELPSDAGREFVYYGEPEPQYLEAYLVMKTALLFQPERGIAEIARETLMALGWREVEVVELETEEATTYFKWK